jgi:hypothetical protein
VAVEFLADIEPASGAQEIPDGWRGLIDFGEVWTELDADLAWPNSEVSLGAPLTWGCELTREPEGQERVRLRLWGLDEGREVMKPGAPFTLRDGLNARASGKLV